jgi:hypothetical protein
MSHPEHGSTAADIVAQQIEGIIEAAQASADQVASAAQAEADAIKAQARESAQAEMDAARRSVVRMNDEARQDAAARIAEAQAAADEVLADAKAVSAGLRQLGQLLTVHAERILRDVQNSHRAISADLRAAGAHSGGGEGGGNDLDDRRRSRAGSGNPFAELDPPTWVEEGR